MTLALKIALTCALVGVGNLIGAFGALVWNDPGAWAEKWATGSLWAITGGLLAAGLLALWQ